MPAPNPLPNASSRALPPTVTRAIIGERPPTVSASTASVT
ncbi:Uncharacterised protein [Mycobacteroides abscessus subsp. abscessus]|nr:Uncharacterised protein [Mycobacteroides abscessus subsp. abscessus]